MWACLAVAVQRWASVADGIREHFAADVRAYEVIARAAPSFPDTGVLRPYAERFPVHWLVGTVTDVTGLALEDVYRVASGLTVAAIVAVLYAVLRRLELPVIAFALALGALAASAYPLHYLLAAPGMISDGIFLLGTTILLLGFARGSFPLVLGGLLVAMLGRQTALPVVVAAAVWALASPAWRQKRWQAAAACVIVPLLLYFVLNRVAGGFAVPRVVSLDEGTVGAYLEDPEMLAEHVGLTTIGILVPLALAFGAWFRTRRPLPRGSLLVAAVIVAQPLLLGPGLAGNTDAPRLAALATPALAVAAGALLRGSHLKLREGVALAAAIAVAGLHPRYTWPAPYDRVVWVLLELGAAVVIVATLAWGGRRASPSGGD
jgi:hypothetical protein